MKGLVYIRVDGSPSIGLGHVVRCIALAQMLIDDFEVHFFCKEIPEVLQEEIIRSHFNFSKIFSEDSFINDLSGEEIIVLDNYYFDTVYQQKIIIKGCKLVCIDDIADRHFVADAIINHGGGINKEDYSVEPYTLLFLGPKYSILRKEFFELNNTKNDLNEHANTNVFICFGGSDPQNVTLQVLKSLNINYKYDNIFCVVGSANENFESLNNFIINSKINIKLFKNLDVNELISYMKISGMAITSASTTAYEYLNVGGSLYLLKTAANQEKLYNYLISNGFAKAYSLNYSNCDPQKPIVNISFERPVLSHIKKIFTTLASSKQFTLRAINTNDLTLVYFWINDLEVRSNSFSKDAITLSDHTIWFYKAIKSNSNYYYIFKKSEQPLGQIRFDMDNNQLHISYLLAPEARGKDLSLILVQMGLRRVIKEINTNVDIVAYVKNDNIASNQVFNKLGFKKVVSSKYPNSHKYNYSFIKNDRDQNRKV